MLSFFSSQLTAPAGPALTIPRRAARADEDRTVDASAARTEEAKSGGEEGEGDEKEEE